MGHPMIGGWEAKYGGLSTAAAKSAVFCRDDAALGCDVAPHLRRDEAPP